MQSNPVLTDQQAREVLRRQPLSPGHLPIGLEARTDPPGLVKELAQLRALIRKYGKTPTTVELRVGAKLAEAMLFLRVKKNRKIYRPWVEKLKVILLEGRFHGDIARAIFDWEGDLRDGQHRLTAIMETGVEVTMDVKFGVDPASFPAMDVGIKRSAAQFLDLEGIGWAAAVAAIVRLRYRVEHSGATPDDEAVVLAGRELADDITLRALQAAARLRAKKQVILSSSALAYRMIALDAKRALSVDEFWDRLVKGDDIKASDPVFKLREHLDEQVRTKKNRKAHQYLTQTQHCAWIIQAWNVWAAGQTSIRFKWDDANALPVVK